MPGSAFDLDYDLNEARDYLEAQRIDVHRHELLLKARRLNPTTLALRLRMLKHSVMPRVIRNPILWVIMLAFIVSALCSYHMDLGQLDYDDKALAGMETFVSFVSVFYFNYCYTRFTSQYDRAMGCKDTICSLCVLASTALRRQEDAQTLWRYLNLAHVAAYCGLSPQYTKENLFNHMCEAHDLLPADRHSSEPEANPERKHKSHQLKSAERQRIEDIDVDKGPLAYHECTVWAMLALTEAHEAGAIIGGDMMYSRMVGMIGELRGNMAATFNFQWQVMPILYTHMISLSSLLFLTAVALLKGLGFTENSSIAFGLFFPLVYITVLATLNLGLIEIGAQIANPWGGDPVDFAVLSFVEATAATSRHIMENPRAMAARGHRQFDALGPSVAGATHMDERPQTLAAASKLHKSTHFLDAEEKDQPIDEASRRVLRQQSLKAADEGLDLHTKSFESRRRTISNRTDEPIGRASGVSEDNLVA